MNFLINQPWCRALLIVAMTAMTTACASAEKAKDDTVGVGIKSLNYSGKEVAYIAVEKPDEQNGGGGGDALNPYSGGGSTICCFSIPKKWTPDLKVVIEYQFYPETGYRKQLVSVAPYAAGKPGDIWLIVHPDEGVEAVVSDFGPTRDEWPGKIRGYPVPSREYQLKKWEEKLARDKAVLAGMKKALQGDTSSLSKEELQNLKDAIKSVDARIKSLEGNKP